MIKIQIMIQMLFHVEKEVQVDFLLLIIMTIFIFNFFRKPIYTKNNKNFKRDRFNSDNATFRFQKNNNNRIPQKKNQEIEIDISNLQYPINSKFIFITFFHF
jgi:hypothetical protein